MNGLSAAVIVPTPLPRPRSVRPMLIAPEAALPRVPSSVPLGDARARLTGDAGLVLLGAATVLAFLVVGSP